MSHVDALISHPAARELWMRFLSRHRGVAWLFRAHEAVRRMRSSDLLLTSRRSLVEHALTTLSREVGESRCGCGVFSSNGARVKQARHLLALARASLRDGADGVPHLAAVESLASSVLARHAAGFVGSLEHLAALRVLSATPTALIRRG